MSEIVGLNYDSTTVKMTIFRENFAF